MRFAVASVCVCAIETFFAIVIDRVLHGMEQQQWQKLPYILFLDR